MDRSALQSLLDELKSSFDYEKFRDRKKPVQTYDSFWVEAFHHYYVDVDDSKRGRDDLLFYVKLDSKQDSETVEVLRRDSKSLPKRTDRGVLWEQTLYLNVLLHEFAYHVSSAILTVKPKSDSVDKVMTKVIQKVYPSPIERRMDSKGKVVQVAYPNIVFCIDNFEDIFSQMFTSKQGQKVAVQLMATNDRVSLEKLVFLGAIDHTTLMETVDEKEQVHVSLSSKLKKQLSLRSKSSKVYDTQHSYHFIQMRGPKLKGYAEMAVIKRDRSYVEQPGVFTYSDEYHSQEPDSHSSGSDSHSNEFDSHSGVFQQSESVEPTLSANDSQKVQSANSLTVGGGGASQGGSMQGGSYSPKLRQAFLGQNLGASLSTQDERDHAAPVSPASPVSRGSTSSQTGLISEGRNGEHNHSIYSHSDVGDYDNEGVVLKEGRGHSKKSEKYNKLSSQSSSHQSTKNKSRESMKDLLLTFARGSRKYKEEEESGDLMFAYLTYIQLPWYALMEDILNGTKPKVL